MNTRCVRTPEERFADLSDWEYDPRYCDDLPDYEGMRMHYVDEGPRDGEVFLCLHGEPSWAYLYRKMIPIFVEAGKRVIAPDFFGFGRSDKPTDPQAYTFDFHRNSLLRLLERLDVQRFSLVCQDWGGLIGLTLPVALPDAIERLVVMNTALAVGSPPGPGFEAWQTFVASQTDLAVGALMKRAAPGLRDEEVAAYDAPFPSAEYKVGVHRFPALVPTSPQMDGAALSRKAATFWGDRWKGPTFMAIGMQDPVLGPPVMRALQSTIAGCPDPLEIADAGHFVQEHGDVVARAALEAFASS